jgi:hypothetical protein
MEVRVFNAMGNQFQTIGHSGSGPGEFQGPVVFFSAGKDSIGILDRGRLKRMVFSVLGKFGHEEPASTQGDLWGGAGGVVGRSMTRGGELNACLRGVLSADSSTSPPRLADVLVDALGRMWLGQYGGSLWKLYGPDGTTLATLTLPSGVEIVDADQKTITVVDRAGEVDRIMLYSVPTNKGAKDCADRRSASPHDDRAAPVLALKTLIRRAMMNAEKARDGKGAYSAFVDSLHIQIPAGYSFKILEADSRGWAGVAFEDRSTRVCMVAVGSHPFPGWIDGVVRCGG